MVLARRRLALVAFLLLTVGGSATVAIGHHLTVDGQPPSVARLLGSEALATSGTIGTAPKGTARGSATSSSKRHARSLLLAALGGALGALAVLGHRLRRGTGVADRHAHHRSHRSRAPPGLAPTLS